MILVGAAGAWHTLCGAALAGDVRNGLEVGNWAKSEIPQLLPRFIPGLPGLDAAPPELAELVGRTLTMIDDILE